MILAAHQPTFCPYGGFFEKVKQSDVFVLLGNVQFEKGVYQNRFMANSNWHTMSVVSGNILIKDKKYATPIRDWDKIKKSYPKLERFDNNISSSLFQTNVGIIFDYLRGAEDEVKLQNDYETHLRGSSRLIDLCKQFGADTYLSGVSGKKYLDMHLFDKAEIEVIFQDKPDQTPFVELL